MKSAELEILESILIEAPLPDGSYPPEKSKKRWKLNYRPSRIFENDDIAIPSNIKPPEEIEYFLQNPEELRKRNDEEIEIIAHNFNETIPDYLRLDEDHYQASQRLYFQDNIWLIGHNNHRPAKHWEFFIQMKLIEPCFRKSYFQKYEKDSMKIKIINRLIAT